MPELLKKFSLDKRTYVQGCLCVEVWQGGLRATEWTEPSLGIFWGKERSNLDLHTGKRQRYDSLKLEFCFFSIPSNHYS